MELRLAVVVLVELVVGRSGPRRPRRSRRRLRGRTSASSASRVEVGSGPSTVTPAGSVQEVAVAPRAEVALRVERLAAQRARRAARGEHAERAGDELAAA